MLDIDDLVWFLISQEDMDCEDDAFDVLSAKYDISPEMFENLIRDLLPLCMVSQSLLTGKNYQGFADRKENRWLIKQEII